MTSATASDPVLDPGRLEPWLAGIAAAREATAVEWLADRRAVATDRFQALGLPTTRDEAWRWTNVQPIARTVFDPSPAPDPDAGLDGLPLPGRETARIVFVNGRLDVAASALTALPEGVRVLGLSRALHECPADLEPHLARLAPESHAFAALNTASFRDGAFVHVAKGAQIEAPVHVVFLARGDRGAAVVHPRVLVVAEPGSRLPLIESWHGEVSGPWLGNAVVEVDVGENARVDHLKVQVEGATTWHVSVLAARLERNARFSTFSLSLGAALARHDIGIELAGEGAECVVDGVYVVDGDQHVDHATNIDHAVPHGTSHQLYKGVLADRSTAAFAGRILVRRDAQRTDARQANHNLLLSREALAESKPQLEIFADDVKCAHGATVGQLDEDAVFYLRSRGLDAATARSLLVRAFALEVPARIENEDLRAHAEGVLQERLERLGLAEAS